MLSLVKNNALSPEIASSPGNTADTPKRSWSDGAGISTSISPQHPWSITHEWPAVVATLSEQCVDTSNVMLNAIDFLTNTGRLRPLEAKTLREMLYALRSTSLRAQQITRLSTGNVRHSRDHVDLAMVVRELLEGRREEFINQAVDVSSELKPVDVLLAAPVAVTVVNALIDWALIFSKQVHLVLETPTWPEAARLVAKITTPAPRPQSQRGEFGGKPRGRRATDGLHWILLQQMAASANLRVRRTGGGGQAVVTIEFPKTFNHTGGISSLELFEADETGARSLLDAWVLVIAADPSLRAAALQCLKIKGISAKAAGDVADARLAVTGTRPDAIVVTTESITDHFRAYRDELTADGHRCPLVQLTESGASFNATGFDTVEVAKIDRSSLLKELAPAVLFELANAL